MTEFNIITYMQSMTGYDFSDREQSLLQIAVNRGVAGATDISQLTNRDKNLMLADMLFLIYTAGSGGTVTKSHGDFSVTVSAKTITNLEDIYRLMMNLYQNPDQELFQAMAASQNTCTWMDFES
jgi:hypothetical protein